jgi:talin
MQQNLLSALVHLSEGLQTLISTGINACGRDPKDPTMTEFSTAMKKEFGFVAELVRVTKLMSDESSRGIRALDGAISEIGTASEQLRNNEPAQGSCLPDEVATFGKMLATGAANLVTVSGKRTAKQDELIAAANVVKKQVLDLCRAGKAVTKNAPKEEREEMFEAVSKSCRASQALLHAMKESRSPNVDDQQNKLLIQSSAKAVALAVSEIVGASANLIPAGYVDMNDPNVVAERELLQAASMIEGAAKKLASLKPVDKPGKKVEDMNFEGQILEAAKAIAAATSALIRYNFATNTYPQIGHNCATRNYIKGRSIEQ